jgi:hypothetical protein
MKKDFHFDSPREWYVCDAVVLSCFGHRSDAGFRMFLQRIGVMNPDHIKIARSMNYLASPGFHGDAQAGAAHHRRELARAAARLTEAIPGLEVQAYFIDFEGVWDAEIDRLPVASGQ